MYQLEYRIGPQQWAEYVGLAQQRSWRAGRPKRLMSRAIDAVVAGTAAGLGLFALQRIFKIDDMLAIAALVAFVVFYGLGIFVALRHTRSLEQAQPRREGIVLGERSALATDEFLEISSILVRSRYEWQAFERVDRLQRMVVLWMEPGHGLVVPKSAFQSDGEMTGFVEYANECIAKAFSPKPAARTADKQPTPLATAAE